MSTAILSSQDEIGYGRDDGGWGGARDSRLKGRESLREYLYFTNCHAYLSGRWKAGWCAYVGGLARACVCVCVWGVMCLCVGGG